MITQGRESQKPKLRRTQLNLNWFIASDLVLYKNAKEQEDLEGRVCSGFPDCWLWRSHCFFSSWALAVWQANTGMKICCGGQHLLDHSKSERWNEKRQRERPIKGAWISRHHHTLECHGQCFHNVAKTCRQPICHPCPRLWSKQSPNLNSSRQWNSSLQEWSVTLLSSPYLFAFCPFSPWLSWETFVSFETWKTWEAWGTRRAVVAHILREENETK